MHFKDWEIEMTFNNLNSELIKLESRISPRLSNSSREIAGRTVKKTGARKDVLLGLVGEIKHAEEMIRTIESRLSFFPRLRGKMSSELRKWESRLDKLKNERRIFNQEAGRGDRRWEYSFLYARIDAAENLTKNSKSLGNNGGRDVLKDLNCLKKLLNSEYKDVRSAVSPVYEIPKTDFGTAVQRRKLPIANEIPGFENVPYYKMPQNIRAVFQEMRSDVILSHKKELTSLLREESFPFKIYIFNREPYKYSFDVELKIDTENVSLIAPPPENFTFPRGSECMRYLSKASAAKDGDWIDAKEAKKSPDFMYNIDSGFFLPGRITARVKMHPYLPEFKANMYLPVLKDEPIS